MGFFRGAIGALEKDNRRYERPANSCENCFSGDSTLTVMNKVVHDVAAVAAATVQTLL